MGESHTEGVKEGKFCAQRAARCDLHGAKYQQNCTPPPIGWENESFVQGTVQKCVKKLEAHHVVCVSCATEFIGKDPKIKPIVTETDWCINKPPNMFAMPLWGHTIKWYCNGFDEADIPKINDLLEELDERSDPPPFQNIPQHDYDHNSGKGYTSEINGNLKVLAAQIAKLAKKDHKAAVKELAGELEALSAKFKAELSRRGLRQKGTHQAWKDGMNNRNPNWYEPFSMANDGSADPRPFPAAGEASKLKAKIQSLLNALGKWGST